MLKVKIETDDLSVELKDSHCDASEENAQLLFKGILQLVFGVEESESPDAIYIEQNQPKDHIQHEGM